MLEADQSGHDFQIHIFLDIQAQMDISAIGQLHLGVYAFPFLALQLITKLERFVKQLYVADAPWCQGGSCHNAYDLRRK
jgi:hypothetical protein